MLKNIALPTEVKVVERGPNFAVIHIEGCHPGYGVTLANALRRVLLSSLAGSAVTSVKIKGVPHEFSTVPGVYEDVVQILLNLKQIRFRLYTEGPFALTLKAKGERAVKAGDIKCPSDVEVINKDMHIATVTSKKGELDMELTVEQGMGFERHTERRKDKLSVGTIAIDAIYSPVRQVSYRIEDMRIGERTDYNRVIMKIMTDGSIEPEVTFGRAARLLSDHFESLAASPAVKPPETEPKRAKKAAKVAGKTTVAVVPETLENLKLSAAVISRLNEGGIKTVAGLLKRRKSTLSEIEGIGEKSIKEITRRLAKFNLELKD